MPKHVKKMLNDLKNNGADDNIKAIGYALDCVLDILIEDREETLRYRAEREKKELEYNGELKSHTMDTESHTPKGILLRPKVVAYLVLSIGIITGIIQYVPTLIKWLMAL